jgi:hypothetical protein
MSDTGKRVKLKWWPYSGGMKLDMLGTVISEHARYLMVKWDGLKHPMAMREEEISLIRWPLER